MSDEQPSTAADAGLEVAHEADRPEHSRPDSHGRHSGEDADDNGPALNTASALTARKRRPGRPTKLTPETQEKIRAGVARGVPGELAARCAGIGKARSISGKTLGTRRSTSSRGGTSSRHRSGRTSTSPSR